MTESESEFETTPPQPDEKEVLRLVEAAATPQGLGAQLLEKHGSQILIVSKGRSGASGWRGGGNRLWGKPTAYWLHESGRWDPTSQPWMDHLEKILAELERNVRRVVTRKIDNTLRQIGNVRRSRALADDVRLHLRSVLVEARGQMPEAFSDVQMCTVDDLDNDLRYLGCKNCIVDLKTGTKLEPSAGREHFVTFSTNVDFDRTAEHPDVERLFSHLGEKSRRWFWGVMGHSLHGRPARRLYLVVGEKGGGKTRMAQALTGSLGEYAGQPMDSALMESGGQGSHSTELSTFAKPVRVCVMDEVATPRFKLSAAILKRITGDGDITFRRLYQNAETLKATATLFLICNPRSVPNLHTYDEAIQDRLRELKYPAVPEEKRDSGLVGRMESPEFRQAFLAKLVAEASKIPPGHPPDDIPTVAQATQSRIEEGVGEFGNFARRLQPSLGNKLPVEEIWQAWCDLHDMDPQDEEMRKEGVQGTKRTAVVPKLRKFVTLPAVKTLRVDGKPVRGFEGWKLLAELKAGDVADLPDDASLSETVTADRRLDEGESKVRRQIRENWGWEEPHIEGPDAAVGTQVIFDDDGNVEAVEPRFWPHPDGDHRPEARYLEPQILKLLQKEHPWPVALKHRVARWLTWLSYGEEVHAALEKFARQNAGEILVLLNEGAKVTLKDADLEELRSALGSHNRSKEECATTLKRFAEKTVKPPPQLGIYCIDLSNLMDVPDDPISAATKKLQQMMAEHIQKLDGAKPLAVANTPSEALDLAAKVEPEERLTWLLLGGEKLGKLDAHDAKALAERLAKRFLSQAGAMNVRVDVGGPRRGRPAE